MRKTLAVYTKSAAPGLQDDHQGREAIEEAVRSFVITEYIRLHTQRGFQHMILDAIAKKAQEGLFRSTLSRSKLQKIIRAYKDRTKKEPGGGKREKRTQEQKTKRLRGVARRRTRGEARKLTAREKCSRTTKVCASSTEVRRR